MNILGILTFLCLILIGKHPKKWENSFYINIGEWWGGLELGTFFLTDNYDDSYVKCHEFGHAIQNLWWGPLYIFVIWIPSIIRYQYRYWKYERKNLTPKTDYYSIWFEKQASELGLKYYKL